MHLLEVIAESEIEGDNERKFFTVFCHGLESCQHMDWHILEISRCAEAWSPMLVGKSMMIIRDFLDKYSCCFVCCQSASQQWWLYFNFPDKYSCCFVFFIRKDFSRNIHLLLWMPFLLSRFLDILCVQTFGIFNILFERDFFYLSNKTTSLKEEKKIQDLLAGLGTLWQMGLLRPDLSYTSHTAGTLRPASVWGAGVSLDAEVAWPAKENKFI